MATSVRGPDATPAAGSCCKFELKEYNTVFTCSVCRKDDFEPKRYRCDHCDLARHESCIQLDKTIEISSSSPISHLKGGVLELHDKPQIRGKCSSTRKRAKQCMLCTEPVKHYSYHYLTNKGKDINMHPCCADRIARSEGSSSTTIKLKAGAKHKCFQCGRKGPIGACTEKHYCWSYLLKIDGQDEYIHVYCYSKMMIKLMKSGDSGGRRTVVKRRRSDGGAELGWEVIAEEATGLVLDQLLVGGGGLIPIISWFFR